MKLFCFIILTFFLIPNKGLSCTCIGEEQTVEDAFKDGEIVISGKIISKNLVDIKDSFGINSILYSKYNYSMVIEYSFKGKIFHIGDTINIVSGLGNGDCGFLMETEKSYVIYGNYSRNKLVNKAIAIEGPLVSTDICHRSRISSIEEINWLKEISKNYNKWWKFWFLRI